MMTATASTTRNPALSGGKIGDPVTNLESVKITAPTLPDRRGTEAIKKAAGLEGSAVQVFEAYTQSHSHTDSGSPVTQIPDIIAGDRLITGGITYNVRTAEKDAASISFGQTLILILTEDRRS